MFWLSLGNLRNWGNAGIWYVNGNNGTGDARWNIGSRLSGSKESAEHSFRRDYPPPLVASGHMAWVNRLKWLHDHWDSSRMGETSESIQRERSNY